MIHSVFCVLCWFSRRLWLTGSIAQIPVLKNLPARLPHTFDYIPEIATVEKKDVEGLCRGYGVHIEEAQGSITVTAALRLRYAEALCVRELT